MAGIGDFFNSWSGGLTGKPAKKDDADPANAIGGMLGGDKGDDKGGGGAGIAAAIPRIMSMFSDKGVKCDIHSSDDVYNILGSIKERMAKKRGMK
jgi:hypothetical protein